MKKYVFLVIASLTLLIGLDVKACGEITELKTDVGTVIVPDGLGFIVRIPEGTNEVLLQGKTEYPWVEGFGPRRVSTADDNVELKVDGTSCGYGIYTYKVKFETYRELIAENEPSQGTTPNETTPPVTTGEPDPSSNESLELETLTIEGVELSFDPKIKEYDFEVEGDVERLQIDYKKKDEATVVSISESANNLEEGLNTISIVLMDAEYNTQKYTLRVTRKEPKSDNNFLANITIQGHQLNFDPAITNYTVEIGKEKTLNITAVKESELADYVILGNSNLGTGSKITITVTAENGSTRDYVLNIKRVFNIMDYWMYIIIILLILLLLIILMIMKKKQKNQKMGPKEVAVEQNTAGVVQEIAPQNATQPTANSTDNQNGATVSEASQGSGPTTLKIIEPTDVVETVEAQATVAETTESDTEIFKL